MILSPDQNQNLLLTLTNFSYAEYGSALEMLAAAKRAKSSKLKIGYIHHALDEYRHTELLFEVLKNQIDNGVGEFSNELRFSPQNVVLKGYLDKKGFLVEKLTLRKFIEFVYSNEYLAKESFTILSKRIKDIKSHEVLQDIISDEEKHADDSIDTLSDIMKDEDRHWGYAKKYYESKFPESKLKYAFLRERIKNKFRIFYLKNTRFLNAILNPVILVIIVLFAKIVNFIYIKNNHNSNLMSINTKSMF